MGPCDALVETMRQKLITINPCPFCGGKAKCNAIRRGNYKRVGDNYQVVCNKCRARGPLVQNYEWRAIAAWNTDRALPVT